MSGEYLEPGAIFGRDFRVVRGLKAGGMGAVYIVDQLSTGKQRALKVLARELATDPGIRERFVLEARAASRIESDHVVEIVTAGVDDDTGAPYLVMELLRGEELADALERTGPLPLGDVAEILSQIGHALEQAHAQGIVHRDLKLENIFLAASRRREVPFTAKILDFGIAKMVADSAKTAGTQPLGTPLFMAPEQTDRGGRICPATDVWALGLIAFRLLTGKDFWRGIDGSLPMLLREIVVDEIPYASVRAQEHGVAQLLPPGFDAWFSACVNRDIDARFPEAGAAVRAFSELVTSDAQRGMLVIEMTSTGDAAAQAALSGLQSGGSVRVTPAAASSVGAPNAATVGVAAAASGGLLTPAEVSPKKGPSPVLIALPVAAVLGGAAAFFLMRSPPPPPPSAGPPASAAASAGAAASAAAPAGPQMNHGTKCPDGMVLLQGGSGFLGAEDVKDAAPAHEVLLSNFCLDKTEVTTGAYMQCFDDKKCPRPLDNVEWPQITDKQRTNYSPFCNAPKMPERKDHPMNCVSWFMADTYCKKWGARLPTEAEWEYAARGSDQRLYPWGDAAPAEQYLNACGKECAAWSASHGEPRTSMFQGDDGFAATAPVGSFPAGASAAGVLDLAGNVWEWTADWYGPYAHDKLVDPKGPEGPAEFRVIRGGDFFGEQPDWAKPAYRYRMVPNAYNHAIGFRCAADPT